MLGRLLRELVRALGRYMAFHLRRLLHRPDRPAEAPAPATSGAGAVATTTANDASSAAPSAEVGLDAKYTRPVPWGRHREAVPPEKVSSDTLYQHWATIPGGHKWSHYFPIYQAIFGPLRTQPLRILEIGIWQGASLKLWKHYFSHPNTVIVGIDILPQCKRFDDPAQGIHIRIGSQTDAAFLQGVVTEFGPFDIVIDDGSHHSSHIISSFNHLYADGLKDSGIYFAEDLHANYWHPWRDSRKSFLDVCKELLEHMHAHYRNAPPAEFLVDYPHLQPSIDLSVPMITTMIQEIRVFDSIAAIYKTRREHVPYYLRTDEKNQSNSHPPQRHEVP